MQFMNFNNINIIFKDKSINSINLKFFEYPIVKKGSYKSS